MTLGDPALADPHDAAHPTIDDLFRGAVARRRDAIALVDPANRESFTDGEPRRLTYAVADRAVAAIAGRLRDLGLPNDAIVGIQLPNIVETVLAMLGVWRAGMIVAPLPLLWRRADAVAALSRIGAKALISCGRAGAFDHGRSALGVAADVFSIRYVCGFGSDLPDGMVPLDDLLSAPAVDPAPPPDRNGRDHAGAKVAVVTFDVGDRGVVPVARSHAELLAGGRAVSRESGTAPEAAMLSSVALSSFGGLCLTLMPWLLGGGALVLHHLFDLRVLIVQRRQERCGTVVLPGALAVTLAEAGAFAVESSGAMLAAWRSPDQLGFSPTWLAPDIALVDVPIFGEAALVPQRRGASGRPAPLLPSEALELTRTDAGTLAARGAMTPHQVFPPGIERSGLPYFKIGPDGLVDTGFACRIDSATQGFVVTDPPSGIVAVGGYRFPLRDLRDVIGRIDAAATLAALPDPLTGRRLIGNAADRATMQAALNAVGVSPLVVAAFRDRTDRA